MKARAQVTLVLLTAALLGLAASTRLGLAQVPDKERESALAISDDPASMLSSAAADGSRATVQEYDYRVYLPLVMKPRLPLFIGLQLRWDGAGYIRGSEYYDIGVHEERELDAMTDADTIRSHNHQWYDPNPLDFDPTTWYTYYSVSTGYFKSSSLPADPSWKWGYYWILPYDWQWSNGQTVSIDGQAFTVSGPHSGYTAFGQAVQYWRLVNLNRFLFWDGGGDWRQYVHAGDAILWYDSGNTRLLLHGDVLRRYYYQGSETSDTVQYITNLTSSNAFGTGAAASRATEAVATPLPGANPPSGLDAGTGRFEHGARMLH